MGTLGRRVFREIAASALLGTFLFTFVLFLDNMRKVFELLIRSSAPMATVGYLFALVMPPVLTFTIPVGVLVGVLLAFSRMSGDAEITAMRAAGVPSRRLAYPALLFATFGLIAAAAASLWLTPFAVRERFKLINRLAAAQLTAEIQPRVFEEKFPNTILYVGDVISGPVVRWKQLFLADVSPPDRRKAAGHEMGEGPKITVAAEAIAAPDTARNRIQLRLLNGSTFVVGKNPSDYYSTSFPTMDQVLEAERPIEIRPRLQFTEMDTLPLWRAASEGTGKARTDARIELHQRLALPLACVLLALVGVPLGISSRKGGKSSAFVLTVLIAFLYYMALISLIGVAREGKIAPALAVWLPNVVLLVSGLIALARMEAPGDRDFAGSIRTWITERLAKLRGRIAAPASPTGGNRSARPFGFLPLLIDTYVLNSFLYYFALLLISFVLMTHVFTFFDLLGDIVRNQIPMWLVGKYLLFLTPHLVYVLTPISVLVGVLVTFGVLSKSNEVTAMKACGVSLYRLAIPVFLSCLAMSGALFAFDYTYIPKANLVQDGIRNQIKGRPPQTHLRPDRKAIFGTGSRIYYYKYFDPVNGEMLGVHVFELDPKTFRLTQHISAERARWERSLNTWVFQNGWARDVSAGREVNYRSFTGATATFPHLTEPPSYFLKEVKQDKQMNPPELASYIAELQQSGFDTTRLQVQFHKKFAVPLFAVIMALISIPFAFVVGTRGAIAGVGISFGIAVTYWAVSNLFEQIGNVNQLPPQLAAWAPDAVFSLGGLYLLTRIRT
jgi:LPS export ABC transporter permease LptG/LPS export ABC transporter permease LptF